MVELDGSTALLRAGDQFKKVHAPSMAGTAESLDLLAVQDARAELDAVVLASLSTKQRDGIYREAKVFSRAADRWAGPTATLYPDLNNATPVPDRESLPQPPFQARYRDCFSAKYLDELDDPTSALT